MIIGSEGDDLINGGDGNDIALMGAGDDTFVWNPGDDNDTLEGQDGFDTMDFNGANVAENITLSANGGRALFTRDIANVAMDLNDVESVNFDALGGADTITINDMSGTDVTEVNDQPRRCRARWRWRGRYDHHQRHERRRRRPGHRRERHVSILGLDTQVEHLQLRGGERPADHQHPWR